MTKLTQLHAAIVLGSAAIGPWWSPAAAQGGVALAGFETDGSVGLPRGNFDALGRAMTALLATEIGSHTRATIVDIRAPRGVRLGRIDVAKARAAAAQAGAKYLIVGTMLDQYGDIRVEARLLNAASGDPVAVVRADQGHTKREDLVEAMTDLAIALGGHAELGGARKAPERSGISVEAMLNFGEGLRFEDDGDRAKAADSYRAALKLSPALTEAAVALRRVGG